jgi:hypothetical protein
MTRDDIVVLYQDAEYLFILVQYCQRRSSRYLFRVDGVYTVTSDIDKGGAWCFWTLSDGKMHWAFDEDELRRNINHPLERVFDKAYHDVVSEWLAEVALLER